MDLLLLPGDLDLSCWNLHTAAPSRAAKPRCVAAAFKAHFLLCHKMALWKKRFLLSQATSFLAAYWASALPRAVFEIQRKLLSWSARQHKHPETGQRSWEPTVDFLYKTSHSRERHGRHSSFKNGWPKAWGALDAALPELWNSVWLTAFSALGLMLLIISPFCFVQSSVTTPNAASFSLPVSHFLSIKRKVPVFLVPVNNATNAMLQVLTSPVSSLMGSVLQPFRWPLVDIYMETFAEHGFPSAPCHSMNSD